MSSNVPDPRHWPTFGDSTPRITEEELREDVEIHERQEDMRATRASWWRRVFRHGSRHK